jgi:hypothetical protein
MLIYNYFLMIVNVECFLMGLLYYCHNSGYQIAVQKPTLAQWTH